MESQVSLVGRGFSLKALIKKYNLLLLLIIFVVIASSMSGRFLTFQNFFNILQQSSVIGVISIGMTFVIIVAGIDLSVGSTAAFAGMICAISLSHGISIIASILLALITGLVAGAINGLITAYLRIPAFIVTLAMMVSLRGATLLITDGKPIFGLPTGFSTLGEGFIGSFPVSGVIWIVVSIVFFLVLKYTSFGRKLYAIGGNPEAAYLSGVRVRRGIVYAFIISGVLAAFGGVLLASWLTVGQPTAAQGSELNAIAAVVLGGTSLFGGKGGVMGTFAGVLLMAVITNIFNLLGLGSYYQSIFQGVIIVAALIMNNYLFDRK